MAEQLALLIRRAKEDPFAGIALLFVCFAIALSAIFMYLGKSMEAILWVALVGCLVMAWGIATGAVKDAPRWLRTSTMVIALAFPVALGVLALTGHLKGAGRPAVSIAQLRDHGFLQKLESFSVSSPFVVPGRVAAVEPTITLSDAERTVVARANWLVVEVLQYLARRLREDVVLNDELMSADQGLRSALLNLGIEGGLESHLNAQIAASDDVQLQQSITSEHLTSVVQLYGATVGNDIDLFAEFADDLDATSNTDRIDVLFRVWSAALRRVQERVTKLIRGKINEMRQQTADSQGG